MVHAHIHIAGFFKCGQRARQHRQLGVRIGQLGGDDPALRLEALGQMRIGIQRNAVRAQFVDLGERAVKRLGRLLRQAVNQVDIDRLEPQLARRRHQGKDLLGRLDPVHCLLHHGVKVLHAKAQPVKAQFGQRSQPPGVNGARIDFNRVFAAGRKREAAPEHGHQLAQFVVAQEGGRAAAQVQLADDLANAQVRGVQIHLPAQVAQVGFTALVVLGDDLVAGAVVAQRLAKRDVHVKGQRKDHGGGAAAALFKRLDEVV